MIRELLPPLLGHLDSPRRYVTATCSYAYGVKLDIWSSGEHFGQRPVFMFIPGGGWAIGWRRPQAYALLSHLARRGWVCVAIDYRTAPQHKWPAPYDDAFQAYEWIEERIAAFGGDANRIVIGGASAGGHLAALLGLTPGLDPLAVVGIYGCYDWRTRDTPYRRLFMSYLERVVVGKREEDYPEIFHMASPIDMVLDEDLPPFLVVHGSKDLLCPVQDARKFVRRLADASCDLVRYHEIAGGLHGFDLVNPGQTAEAINVIEKFLTHITDRPIQKVS